MIAAVLDTNVLAAGVIGLTKLDSIPGELLRLWRAGAFRVILSEPIMTELERTLGTPYFARRLSADEIRSELDDIRADALMQPITMRVAGVAAHPHDDLIIATAVSANAPYLVTGDKPLLARGSYQGTQILTPRQFLAILNREQHSYRE